MSADEKRDLLVVMVVPCATPGCFRRLDAYPARPLGEPEDPKARAELEESALKRGWTKREDETWLCSDCAAGKPTAIGEAVASLTLEQRAKYAGKKINYANYGTLKIGNLEPEEPK